MESKALSILVLFGMFGLFPFALFATGKVIFHVYKVVTNVTGKYTSLFGAALLFMPSQFNEEGNFHRVQLLRWLPWVVVSDTILFGLKYARHWV